MNETCVLSFSAVPQGADWQTAMNVIFAMCSPKHHQPSKAAIRFDGDAFTVVLELPSFNEATAAFEAQHAKLKQIKCFEGVTFSGPLEAT